MPSTPASRAALITRVIKRQGMAHDVTYTPLAGAPVACAVTLQAGVQELGEYGAVVGYRDEATFLRSQLTPSRGGSFVLSGVTYALESLISDDGVNSRWVVRRG